MNKIKLLLVSMTLLSLTACQTKPKVEEGKIGGTLTVVTSRPDAAELFEEIEEGFKKKYPEVPVPYRYLLPSYSRPAF